MKIDKRKLLLAMARERINSNDLYEKAGVSKTTFDLIKSGKRNPKPATVGKIAYALGVQPEELISEEI